MESMGGGSLNRTRREALIAAGPHDILTQITPRSSSTSFSRSEIPDKIKDAHWMLTGLHSFGPLGTLLPDRSALMALLIVRRATASDEGSQDHTRVNVYARTFGAARGAFIPSPSKLAFISADCVIVKECDSQRIT
jgi:hypothetical protein